MNKAASKTKSKPAYIIKLCMIYAASEGTLPEITLDQLSASILVGGMAKHV
jgi:hypothetical protein